MILCGGDGRFVSKNRKFWEILIDLSLCSDAARVMDVRETRKRRVAK